MEGRRSRYDRNATTTTMDSDETGLRLPWLSMARTPNWMLAGSGTLIVSWVTLPTCSAP